MNGNQVGFLCKFDGIKITTIMYNILSHAHSGLRYLVLFAIVAATVKAFQGWMGKKTFTPQDKKFVTLTVIFAHIQLLLGLSLYFINNWYSAFSTEGAMKDPLTRFFAVEHLTGMIAAIVLITVASARSKRQATDEGKFKTVAIFFAIALLLILAMIPWPFMSKFAHLGWF
ncbi:MAG: hypothetical protein Fur0041_03760 [Bacteroidia bacterium]